MKPLHVSRLRCCIACWHGRVSRRRVQCNIGDRSRLAVLATQSCWGICNKKKLPSRSESIVTSASTRSCTPSQSADSSSRLPPLKQAAPASEGTTENKERLKQASHCQFAQHPVVLINRLGYRRFLICVERRGCRSSQPSHPSCLFRQQLKTYFLPSPRLRCADIQHALE